MVDRAEYDRVKRLKDQFRIDSTQHQQEVVRLKSQSASLRQENADLNKLLNDQKHENQSLRRNLDDVKELLRKERSDHAQTQSESRYLEQESFIARRERDEYKQKYDYKDIQWKTEKQRLFDRTVKMEKKLSDLKRNYDKYVELKMGVERGKWDDELRQMEAERNAALLTAETLRKEHDLYRDRMARSADRSSTLTPTELSPRETKLNNGDENSSRNHISKKDQSSLRNRQDRNAPENKRYQHRAWKRPEDLNQSHDSSSNITELRNIDKLKEYQSDDAEKFAADFVERFRNSQGNDKTSISTATTLDKNSEPQPQQSDGISSV